MSDARFLRWYFFLLLFWVVFQISFLNLLFPDIQMPIGIFASIVALAIIFPLSQALGWSLVVIILFDILRFGFLTPLVFGVFPLVVCTNFVTKRFAADSRARFQPRLIFFFVVLVVVCQLFLSAAWPSIQDIIIAVSLFPMVFYSLHRMQEWLVASSFVEFRGVR